MKNKDLQISELIRCAMEQGFCIRIADMEGIDLQTFLRLEKIRKSKLEEPPLSKEVTK